MICRDRGVKTFPVPREAMREVMINAVIHRECVDPVPIQIRVYDDWIMPGDGLWLEFAYCATYRAADAAAGSGQAEGQEGEALQTDSGKAGPLARAQPESLEARLLTWLLLTGGSTARVDLPKSVGHEEFSGQLNNVVRRPMADRMVECTLSGKPRSRLQKCRLTDRGRAAVSTSTRGRSTAP